MPEFRFGSYSYTYELVRQDRKTLSLTVKPDLSLIVKAPLKADLDKIETFLKKKWFWLEKQLSFFKKYHRKVYKKEYVSGESFMYLGRQYKLVVKRATEVKVQVSKGCLYLFTVNLVGEGAKNKRILEKWFLQRAEQVFLERYEEVQKRFDYKTMPQLELREMKKRWGSYRKKDRIYLNPKLVHVSKDCIDYVITHELCHLRYKKHGEAFYKFLNKKFPDWEKVKEKLEIAGA